MGRLHLGPGQSFDKFFSNFGWPRPSPAGLSAAAKSSRKFCYLHRPLTSPAYPSLRGYRRAETADGPRRRQSVLHMRAQMLRSLFLARHGEGGAGRGVALTNSSLESLWTTGHHPQMHRQLRAGRRVCRRELLEASAQPTAFSPGRAKGAVIVVGCFYRGLRQRGCRAGV